MRRIFLKYFIIFIIIIFSFTYIYAQEYQDTQNNNLDRKDPLLAALLSWYMPGLGLIYSESFLKGFIYYSIDNLILWFMVSKFATFKLSFNQLIGLNFFGFSDIEGFDKTKINDLILTSILWIGFRVINIIDSAYTAYNYNIKNNLNYSKEINFSPFIVGLLSWIYPGVGQFLIKDYFTGSIFVLVDFLQKIYLGGIIFSQFPNSEKPLNYLDDIKTINWQNLSNESKFVIISYLLIDIGKKVFSSIMAYNKAKEKIEKSKKEKENFSFVFTPYFIKNLYGFSIYLNF